MWDYNMRNGWKSVYVVERKWHPATARWETPWANEGGDFDDSKPIAHSNSDTTVKRWEIFDVTETVKQFVQNPSSNFGFLLKFDDDDRRGIMVYSSESKETDKRPKLIVTCDSSTEINQKLYLMDYKVTFIHLNGPRMVYLPFKGEYRIYDLQGRIVASFTTQADKIWYKLPCITGINIISMQGNKQALTRTFIIIK